MSRVLALLRLALVVTGPVAIWFSFRWTATAEGVAQFDGFLDTSRALAAYGATAWIIASGLALTGLTGDGLVARLARAVHPNAFLLMCLAIIGMPALLVVPVLAMLVCDGDSLVRPQADDGLSMRARPTARIGQVLALAGSGFPILAAAMDWIGTDLALNAWLVGLWLAAAFKLYRFIPRALRAN